MDDLIKKIDFKEDYALIKQGEEHEKALGLLEGIILENLQKAQEAGNINLEDGIDDQGRGVITKPALHPKRLLAIVQRLQQTFTLKIRKPDFKITPTVAAQQFGDAIELSNTCLFHGFTIDDRRRTAKPGEALVEINIVREFVEKYLHPFDFDIRRCPVDKTSMAWACMPEIFFKLDGKEIQIPVVLMPGHHLWWYEVMAEFEARLIAEANKPAVQEEEEGLDDDDLPEEVIEPNHLVNILNNNG